MNMQTVKDILEMISFITAPIIVFIAYKALDQIKEAKKQVLESKESRIVSAKRESYKIAAEKCEYYMSNIIPKLNQLDKAIDEHKLTFLTNSVVKLEKDKISVKLGDLDELIAFMAKHSFTDALNSLESFSIFFTSGVAEDKVGFLTLGSTYCRSVEKLLPVLALLSQDKNFLNTLKLFRLWHERLEREKLEKEKARIEKELKNNTTITIKSIGTE